MSGGWWLLGGMTACGVLLVVATLRLVPARFDITLSQHIMRHPRAVIFGKVLLPLIGGLLAAWTLGYSLPLLLTSLLLLLSVFFVIMGLLPYGVNARKDRVHDMAAWGSVPLIILAEMAALWFYQGAERWVILAALSVQLALVAVRVVPFLKPWRQKLTLIGQLVFFAGLFATLWILEVAHA